MNEGYFKELEARELEEQRRSVYGMVALVGMSTLVVAALAYALRVVELTWR